MAILLCRDVAYLAFGKLPKMPAEGKNLMLLMNEVSFAKYELEWSDYIGTQNNQERGYFYANGVLQAWG